MAFASCSYVAATYQPKLKDCNGADLPAGTEMATCADLAAITIADATETVKGKVELATTAEASAGTSTTTVVTPAGLKAALDAAAPNLKTCSGADMAFDAQVPTCTEMNAAIAASVVTVPDATDTTKGKVALNAGTSLPGDATNCTDALTACGLNALLTDPAAGGNAVINNVKALVPDTAKTVRGLVNLTDLQQMGDGRKVFDAGVHVGSGNPAHAGRATVTAIGLNAGASNTGDYQTATGYVAGQNNTGYSQTATGVNAGQNNTGDYQTASGHTAGQNNTGYSQTATGVNAGQNNTGYSQTAAGYAAGQNNTGDYQIATGYVAGQNNTGDYQTATGYAAGQNNTGYIQTASGHTAGQNNTGYSQTATGYGAGYNNTGDYQTATGVNAGQNNTGDYQTATGYAAGQNNTGDYQTATGYGAGYNNTGLNNSFYGHESGTQTGALLGTVTMTPTSSTAGTVSPALPASVVGTSRPVYITSFDWRVLTFTSTTAYTMVGGPASGTWTASVYEGLAFNNVTALGYDSEPTASNQVMLGNGAVTEVRTAGTYFGAGFTTVSDATLKENVEPIDPAKALQFRNGLQWKHYEVFAETQSEVKVEKTFDREETVVNADGSTETKTVTVTVSEPTGAYKVTRVSQGTKYGLIAQDVQALAASIGDFSDVVVEVGEYFTLDAQGYPVKDAQGNNIVNKRLGLDYDSIQFVICAGEQSLLPAVV